MYHANVFSYCDKNNEYQALRSRLPWPKSIPSWLIIRPEQLQPVYTRGCAASWLIIRPEQLQPVYTRGCAASWLFNRSEQLRPVVEQEKISQFKICV